MNNTSRRDRLHELLADRALVGLDANETAELDALLKEFPNEDADAFDRAAAATMLVHMGKIEPMPQLLVARIEAQTPKNKPIGASVRIAPTPVVSASVTPIGSRRDPFRLVGWLAAAACFAVAAYSWFGRPPEVKIVQVVPSASTVSPGPTASTTPPPNATLADLRTALAADPLATKIPWSPTKDPGAAGASGDVVFSVAKQTGFMRFHGLAANDPKQHQYQLWIFDKAKDQKYPVDGGVFDVRPDPDGTTGDVIVQIQPKIRVTDPTLFAVTVEEPGGVVVSKREHIVVTAAKS
jgi:Anti-sigma-K factor rskA